MWYGKRELAAGMLGRLGALDVVLRARALSRAPVLTVLGYHRVASTSGSSNPFDDGVVDATPDQFETQVKLLKRHFTLISIDQLIDILAGAPAPPNPAMITFDDGYRACLDVVAPILKRHDAQAVFFIPTMYINDRRVFWWDRLTYLVKRTTQERIRLDYPRPLEIELFRPERAVQALLTVVKTEHALDLDHFLNHVTERCKVDWSRDFEREIANELLLDWDGVRALRDAGMGIESHTHTHRVLQTLPPQDLRRELMGSRQELESRIERPVRAIAYPVGPAIARRPDIRAEVEDAGYQVGFTYPTGLNLGFGRIDRLNIRRLSVEPGTPAHMFLGSLAIPLLASRNRIHLEG